MDNSSVRAEYYRVVRKGYHYSRKISRALKVRHIFILTAFLALISCGTTKQLQVVERIHQDTIYLNKVQYDSVFYSIDHYIDRTSDTIYVRDVSVQYKYKLLRDTTFIHQVDSIPVIKEVEVIREVRGTCAEHSRSIPWWSKALNWIGAVLLIGLILRIAIKLYLHKL